MQPACATARIVAGHGAGPPPAVVSCFSPWCSGRRGSQATSWLAASCPTMASSRWSSRSWWCSRFSSRGSRPDSGPHSRASRPWPSAATAIRSHAACAPAHARGTFRTTRALRSSCPSATKTSIACLPACAPLASRWLPPARPTGSISTSCPTRGMPQTQAQELAAWRKLCRDVDGIRTRVLSVAPAPHQAQERQHRGFLPPVGTQLSLHGGARCRQRHVGRVPDPSRADRGGQSGRRNHPDGAARGASRYVVRARATVRKRDLWSRVRGRPALLAARRIALLGTQRHHQGRAVHEALRARPVARARRVVRRNPFARLRRGGPHATSRLVRVDRLRPAGQLRGDAAEPARRAGARPPLVPGQPQEHEAVRDERPEPGASGHVRDRCDGLPVGAAVARRR